MPKGGLMDSRNPAVLVLAIIGALALMFLLGMWLTHGTMMGGMMRGWAWPLGVLVVVGIVVLIVLLTRRP
ncbi:MAG TPA: hypothetical protein VGK70_02050 [Thermoanaerobaculia bacterium]|jgi:hypothetical protein